MTVKASRKADKIAAEKENNKDSATLDLTFNNSFVNIVSIRFFMKKIPATMNISNKITSRLCSISYKTASGLVKFKTSA